MCPECALLQENIARQTLASLLISDWKRTKSYEDGKGDGLGGLGVNTSRQSRERSHQKERTRREKPRRHGKHPGLLRQSEQLPQAKDDAVGRAKALHLQALRHYLATCCTIWYKSMVAHQYHGKLLSRECGREAHEDGELSYGCYRARV